MRLDTNKYFTLLMNGRIEEAESIRQASVPNKLIKFIWLDGSESDEKKFKSLQNDELWFANKDTLNDPYEFCGISVDEQKFLLAGYTATEIENIKHLISFDDIGVSCLSANDVSFLPMWAYYTNNHRGFCIEFDVIKKDCIHEILYEPKAVKIASLIGDVIKEGKECMRKGISPTPALQGKLSIIMQTLYMKNESWRHEAEYRIAVPLDGQSGINIKVNNLGMRTHRIIAGYKCSDTDIERLNAISQRLGLGPVYRSYLQDGEYSLKLQL